MKSIAFILLFAACSQNQVAPSKSLFAVEQTREQRTKYEATGKTYMIATQGSATTQAAVDIFKQGGNIIDAAVAASYTISVERPHSTGLGGGGFMIYRDAKTGKVFAIDFRERAPGRSTEKMFLDRNGDVVNGLSTNGALAAGIPGLVAGLSEIHKKFGKLQRQKVMRPAIQLAENGFAVYKDLALAIQERKPVLSRFSTSAQIFLKPNGEAYEIGDRLLQKNLAESLKKIARGGPEVFYRGEIAKQIVSEIKKQKGILSLEDLKKYSVKWREPVRGKFHEFEIVAMPPPSSGGAHVIEILNILGDDDLKKIGYGSANALHLEASAMQQAFADRASFMGDPDFVNIPLKGLLSKEYARHIRSMVDIDHAKKVTAGTPAKYESPETTNFTIMDAEGNVVISTQTINGWMGSALVAGNTGILLNNEMDDFSAKPGASNIYGAVGSTANAVKPWKTPLSSMAPTLVLKDNKPVLAVGAPGGTRIITCVAQTILNYLGFGLPLYESVNYLRVHHQWSPDKIEIEEPGFQDGVLRALKDKSYQVDVTEIGCRVNAIANKDGVMTGVADARDIGASYGE